MKIPSDHIRADRAITSLLSKMPKGVADSFDDKQLLYLKTALGTRSWSTHAVDHRGTFKIPLMPWRFYYVLLLGRNYRELSRREKRISMLSLALFSSLVLIASVLMGLLVLYLVKSALGIDLFPNFSLGIWGWFKGLWYQARFVF